MAREDYSIFGDIITFDTTYHTNKYNLSLGLFCDVNHHKTTVIFVAGFISKENTNSFVWLFNQFLDCMSKALVSVITDQDLTIKAVVAIIFLFTFHRLCK